MQTKEILKELRKEKNYSAQQVADGCSMSIGVYKKYESGERGVGTPALCKFADFYNVSTDYLLGREKPVKPDLLTMLTQEFHLTELEKVLVQAYINISPKEREKFIQNIEETVRQKEEAQQQQQVPASSITQATPQNTSQTVQPPPPPDIQISKMSSEFAIARGGNGMYKPLPTDEQMESFEEVTPDMI